jgi:hypothetical protein
MGGCGLIRHAHAVAAVALGPIERGVGVAQQLLGVLAAWRNAAQQTRAQVIVWVSLPSARGATRRSRSPRSAAE